MHQTLWFQWFAFSKTTVSTYEKMTTYVKVDKNQQLRDNQSIGIEGSPRLKGLRKV